MVATPVPERFGPDGEPHPFLQRFKRSWIQRFRHTRMEPIFEGVDLANFLVALGREAEALDLLEWLVEPVVFAGNYNIWTAAGCGITLRARLLRLSGDAAGRAGEMARLFEHDYRVPVAAGELAELLGKMDSEMAEAAADTPKWGAHGLSRYLMDLHYFRETAEGGFAHSGSYAVEPLEHAIRACYDALAARLR